MATCRIFAMADSPFATRPFRPARAATPARGDVASVLAQQARPINSNAILVCDRLARSLGLQGLGPRIPSPAALVAGVPRSALLSFEAGWACDGGHGRAAKSGQP